MAISPGLMQQKPRGLFGAVPTAMSRPTALPSPMPQAAEAQPQKPGFDWRKLLGVLGDSLSIAGGGQASYVPMMQENMLRRQAQDYAEQTYQRRRADENTDWQARQEWEVANKPVTPYRWESNDGSLMELGADGQPRVAYKDPTPKINWVRADNGDGTFTMVPMGPNGPINLNGQGGAPAAPKGKLTPYNGGQTATPSGTFQR